MLSHVHPHYTDDLALQRNVNPHCGTTQRACSGTWQAHQTLGWQRTMEAYFGTHKQWLLSNVIIKTGKVMLFSFFFFGGRGGGGGGVVA